MAAWQTAEAKQQFTKMIEAAEKNGPQVVMRHKEPVAVVMSADDYRTLKRQADASFAELLKASPFEPGDIPRMPIKLGNAGYVDELEEETKAAS